MKRKSDRLMTLKTRNFMGPGKNSDDPFVILEERELEPPISITTKRMKSWKKIQKGLIQ